MTVYTLVPVGINGPIERLSQRVEGWDLRLIEENVRLRRQLVVAQAAARHMEELRLRMDNESALRTRAQQRLWKVGLALATIANNCPAADEAVVAARQEIWGSDV